jgi:hypothetical protein
MSAVVPPGQIVNFSYVVIAYNGTVLADCSYADDAREENRAAVLGEVEKVDPSQSQAAGDLGGSRFLVLSSADAAGLRYACLAHATMSNTNGFECLRDLQSLWVRSFGAGAAAPRPEFREALAPWLRRYNSAQYEKIAKIRDQAREAQEETSKNIQRALERGEAIDEMADKAETLRDSAQTYHHQATALKNQLCWAKWRWRMLAAGVGLVAVFAIVWFACGLEFESC